MKDRSPEAGRGEGHVMASGRYCKQCGEDLGKTTESSGYCGRCGGGRSTGVSAGEAYKGHLIKSKGTGFLVEGRTSSFMVSSLAEAKRRIDAKGGYGNAIPAHGSDRRASRKENGVGTNYENGRARAEAELTPKLARFGNIGTRNEANGFYGTVARDPQQGKNAKKLWDEAVRAITSAYGVKEPLARDFLDSSLGRHLADQVLDGKGVASAVTSSGFLRWKKTYDPQDYRNAVRTTGGDPPSLRGGVSLAGVWTVYYEEPSTKNGRLYPKAKDFKSEAEAKKFATNLPEGAKLRGEGVRKHGAGDYQR